MANFRVLKVYEMNIEADTKEEAENLFDLMESEESFTLSVDEIDDNGNEIEED